MSWGHSSMLSNVKKLFKKGPYSSPKGKRSSSPTSTDSSTSNGHSNSRGRSAHSSGGGSGHGRESSVSTGRSSSREKRSNGQAGAHPYSQDSTSNGHSSINQLFPTSPRATGFDDYVSSQSASPRPASPASSKSAKSTTKAGTDPMLKVAQVLGVSMDELVDYAKGEHDEDSAHYIYECDWESEDDESFADTPAIYSKSEIPSSFEFHRPQTKVVENGGNLAEPRRSLRRNPEAELPNVSFKFGEVNPGHEANNKSAEDVLLETYEPASAPTRKTTTLYNARSLPEEVISRLTQERQWRSGGGSRPSREHYAVESRLSSTHTREGTSEITGGTYRPHRPSPNQRRSGAPENGSTYMSGEESAAEFHNSHYKVSAKSPVPQSPSPRSNFPLTNGFQSPRSQMTNGVQSPRSQSSSRGTTWVPTGSHSPERRSWSSNSSAKARQAGSGDSNGSASPQWVYSGYPSPDGGIRSDRTFVQGHPLPAPPPVSSPQHSVYVTTVVRVLNHQESPHQSLHSQHSVPPLGHRVTSSSSQYVPPRVPRSLSPVVSPLPSPPRSPMVSSSRPLNAPYSPRSPLLVPPLSTYSSPPKSPSRAPKIPTKWAKIRQIGTGSFGTVHEAMNLEDSSFFAVKISRGETITHEIQKEIEVLSYLKHPNVVQYYGTGQEDGHLCIFLELMQNSLQSIIKHFEFFDETLISTYTRQILQGLEYLHKKNTIHRDIKCANILVDKDGQVKLADFGLAKECYVDAKLSLMPSSRYLHKFYDQVVVDASQVGLNPATSCKGTPYFMAPEILRPDKSGKKGYGLPVDIWSLGCTVVEMADGKPPWSGTKGFSWFFQLLKGELPPIPPHLSPACVDFIRNCLRFKPEQRPTASELLRHPFVANAPATAVSPAIVAGSVTTNPAYVSPSPVPFFRNGPPSDEAQSRYSGGPPSPPSPRQQRSHGLQRTLSRSFSNPCMDTQELQEAIHAPRTPPPAATRSDYGRNYGFARDMLQSND